MYEPSSVDYEQMFTSLPAAMLAVDGAGALTAYNPAAAELFGAVLKRDRTRCCDLVGCGRGGLKRLLAQPCVTVAVLERDAVLHGLDFELNGRRVDLSVGPLESGHGAVLVAHAPDRGSQRTADVPMLRVKTFGGLGLASEGRALDGEWLYHRPGQLLRYLICARGRRVPAEELIDALWPGARGAGATSLRQAVHVLRRRLEPHRTKHSPCSLIEATKGGYRLDMTNVMVDADEFETEANAALVALERSGDDVAQPQLARAAGLYGGEFLADEPYAEWVLEERDRLRALALRVLRALGEIHLAAGRTARAQSAFQRVAEFEPLDPSAQRQLIALMLRLDRHAEAARRYEVFRRRFRRTFDCDPGFTLGELVRPEQLNYRIRHRAASASSSFSMRTRPR
jgi:DNA-binding SARP family transcriptional activator